MTLRTDPTYVRTVLAYVDQTSVHDAYRHFGKHPSTIQRWVDARTANGPEWPTDADIEHWHATKDARAQNALRLRRYRDRTYIARGPMLIDATGTTRRLQALARLGWLYHELGTRLGVSDERVGHLIRHHYPVVHRDTAARVAKLYDELSMTIPNDVTPTKRGEIRPHERQRRAAESKGWAAPLAWDDARIDDPNAKPYRNRQADQEKRLSEVDEAVVQRVLGGEVMHCTKAERDEIMRRWVALGGNRKDLAARMRWHDNRYGKGAA